jgi:hypothetical protein
VHPQTDAITLAIRFRTHDSCWFEKPLRNHTNMPHRRAPVQPRSFVVPTNNPEYSSASLPSPDKWAVISFAIPVPREPFFFRPFGGYWR